MLAVMTSMKTSSSSPADPVIVAVAVAGTEDAGPAKSISVADVIQAIDGPFTVTACSTEKNDCEQYSKCSVRDPLWQIRERIVAALDTVTLSEMAAEQIATAPVAVVRRA